MSDEAISELATRLAVLYDAAECVVWLLTPHPLLNGEPPAAVWLRGESHRVLVLVEQLESGAFI